jgi:Bacterial Ig-like domain
VVPPLIRQNPVLWLSRITRKKITAEAGSHVKLFDESTQIGTTHANASGNWTYATAELPEGTHSFTATATDAAGNSSSGSSPLNVKVDAVGAPSSPSSRTPTPRGENLLKNGLEAPSTCPRERTSGQALA